jgi:hypothetical protein
MKILLSVVAVIVLMIGCFTAGKTSAQMAYAETAFQSGYRHGCDDADKQPNTKYINSFGNTESHHTAEFMDGYHKGFRACAGPDAQHTSSFMNSNQESIGEYVKWTA